MALYTIGNQFNETTSYGKVNLDKLEIYKTANNIQEFLTTQYNLSTDTITRVFGTNNQYNTTAYNHTGRYRTIPNDPTDIPEIITTGIVINTIQRFEKAIQIADGLLTYYNQAIIDNPMTLSGNTLQDKIYKDSYIHSIGTSIYNTHYATNAEDISIYELQKPIGMDNQQQNFSHLPVLFTSRMGVLHHNRVETLDTMLMQTMVEHNNKTIDQYGAEYLTEILQLSLQFLAQTNNNANIEYISPKTRSCGFFVRRDPNNPTRILNIRAYVTHVINFQLHDTTYPIALSSGFDMTDLIDMNTFIQGHTFTNFVSLFNNICLTLNGDNTGGFTTNDTLWEFGPNDAFDTLRCKSSHTRPYWNGVLIKDISYKGYQHIPDKLRIQMEYMNNTYTQFNNDQMILFAHTDNDNDKQSIYIIHVIKNGTGQISIQTKDARIDTIFPLEPIGIDTAFKGTLLVENTKGGSVLLVNPLLETTSIQGQMGIGTNTPHATMDIDDTSVGDMTKFISNVAEQNKQLLDMTNGLQNLLLENDMQWYNADNHTINNIIMVANSNIATYYLGAYTVVADNGYNVTHYIIFSSIYNEVKHTTNNVSMPELTFTEAQWNALDNNTQGHVLIETMTTPTHADIRNKATTIGDPTFIYQIDMTSKNAKDTIVTFHKKYQSWIGNTIQHIMDTTETIQQEEEIQDTVLPIAQSIISDTLCYAGSAKSFVTTHNNISNYVITSSILFGKTLTTRRTTIRDNLRSQIVHLQKIAKNAEIDSFTYIMSINDITDTSLGPTWNGGDANDIQAMGNIGIQRSGGSNIPNTDQQIWKHAFIHTMERLLQIMIEIDIDTNDFWNQIQNINLQTMKNTLEQELIIISDIGYALDIQNNITTVEQNNVLDKLIQIHTLFHNLYVTPTLYIIGNEINMRDTTINIRNTTYVQEWFKRIHATDTHMNIVQYYHRQNIDTFAYGLAHANSKIQTLIHKYTDLNDNIYIYTMAENENTLSLDSTAAKATVTSTHVTTASGPNTVIDQITDPVIRDMHALFVTQYATNTTPIPIHTVGKIGARGHLHPHAYYFIFYQLSNTQILMFYADMSTNFFSPSFQLTGDMDIHGDLTVRDGVWIGGKLLRAVAGEILWGDVLLGSSD